MAGLNKRQIILIIIASLAIIYGAFVFLSGRLAQKDAKSKSASEEKGIINTMTSELMKSPLSVADAYIISRAETDWQKNPFMEKRAYKEWAMREGNKAGVSPESKIIYSGYVDSGKKKMAVINGLEYNVGDQLETGGYVLKKITSAKIVIKNKDTGSELEIPIQE